MKLYDQYLQAFITGIEAIAKIHDHAKGKMGVQGYI